MTFDSFEKFQGELLDDVRAMAQTKGKEYANNDGEDRFANFERLALRLGLAREKVLWVYLVKHLDGIESFVRNGREFSNERVQGRIVDAITYLTLLAGMFAEDTGNTPK